MGNPRLEPISAIEDPPDPPEGFGPWSEYTDPGGRWLPKAAKAGAFTATTVVSGFLFAFALGAVPGLDMISFGAVTPATALIAGLAVLVLLVGVHEGLHGVVGYLIGADVSFASGRWGGFRTFSQHTIQGHQETIAFYLVPLIVGTPLWFGVLLVAGAFEAPHALLVTNIALAANVGGSALDLYHAWGIGTYRKARWSTILLPDARRDAGE